MMYKFLQSVHIAGKDFPRGVHEVSEKVETDPNFLMYVGCGWIVEPESAAIVSLETPEERNKKLLDKIMKEHDARRAKIEKPVEPKAPEKAPEAPVGEDQPEDDKPKGKGRKQKSR